MAVEIAPGLTVPDDELVFAWIRAPGPGGQNVNKVATAVQLRFHAAASSLLDASSRARFATLAGRRLTQEGWLVLTAHRHRSQDANRRDALARLAQLIVAARIRPKTRRPTRPTRAARERRLDSKKQRTQLKRLRSRPHAAD